jgi:predicted deacetylase
MSCAGVGNKKSLIVSLHDFHGISLSSINRQIDWLRTVGVDRTTILAVPDYHGKGALRSGGQEAKFLREMMEAGHEVALHGYNHLRMRPGSEKKSGVSQFFFTRLYTANEAEFYDLSEREAAELLREGVSLLSDCGVLPRGFVAPGWLISPGAIQAIWKAGMEWTCLAGVILGREGFMEHARSFCWSTRSAWRVPASVIWNRLLFARNAKSLTVRVSLHPADLEYGSIRNQIQNILSYFVEKNHSPLTYGEYVALHEGRDKKFRNERPG